MNIAAITAKLNAGQTLTPEERAFLNTHLDGQASVPATPDMSSWPPEARAAFEQSQATARAAQEAATAAQATASNERGIRLNREFSEKALALGQTAEFGATLRAASESMSAEHYAALEERLMAAHEQTRLTAVIGAGAPNGSSTAQAAAGVLEAKAQEYISAGMDPEKAYAKAMTGNAEAAGVYSAEMAAGAPRI